LFPRRFSGRVTAGSSKKERRQSYKSQSFVKATSIPTAPSTRRLGTPLSCSLVTSVASAAASPITTHGKRILLRARVVIDAKETMRQLKTLHGSPNSRRAPALRASPSSEYPRKPTEREIAISAARFLRRAVELTRTKKVSANSQSANLSFRLVVSWPVVGVLPWCRLRVGRTAPCHSVGRRGSRQLAPRTTIWCASAPFSPTMIPTDFPAQSLLRALGAGACKRPIGAVRPDVPDCEL
jgi:hypothetical protein